MRQQLHRQLLRRQEQGKFIHRLPAQCAQVAELRRLRSDVLQRLCRRRRETVDRTLLLADHPAGKAARLHPVQQSCQIVRIDRAAIEHRSIRIHTQLSVVQKVAVKVQSVDQVSRADLKGRAPR